MSNHDNHRRAEEKRSEHGPRYEGGGSDNSAVARSRKKWKRRRARQFRRTGKTRGCGTGGSPGARRPKPPPSET